MSVEYVSCPECGACLPNGKELRCCACNHLLNWQPFFEGRLVPEPRPSDVVLVDYLLCRDHKLVVHGCNCFGDDRVWPPPEECGAHAWYLKDGRPLGTSIWNVTEGWLYSGVILQRSKTVEVVAALDPATLRVANTRPGATVCAKCGKPLKSPMGGLTGFQHCPICEP